MSLLLESPWPALVIGVIVEAVLAIAFLRTGLAKILIAMAGVLAITLLLLLVERVVVTEFEEIEDTLYAAAAAIEAGDVQRVVDYVSPQAPELKQYAERALRQFTLSEVRIGNDLKVQVNPLASPRSADVHFTVKITGRDRKGSIPGGTILERADLTLHKIDGRWYVADYQPRH
jgi:hypothetical protein